MYFVIVVGIALNSRIHISVETGYHDYVITSAAAVWKTLVFTCFDTGTDCLSLHFFLADIEAPASIGTAGLGSFNLSRNSSSNLQPHLQTNFPLLPIPRSDRQSLLLGYSGTMELLDPSSFSGKALHETNSPPQWTGFLRVQDYSLAAGPGTSTKRRLASFVWHMLSYATIWLAGSVC